MIRHFFKIAVRNIRKKGLFSFLNIAGLSVGIASFLVIALYAFQETSYEKRHQDYDNIFRLEEHFLSMGRLAWSSSNLQHRLGEIPEIEDVARFAFSKNAKVKVDNQSFAAKNLIRAEDSFFALFDFDFISGNPESALSGPGQAVISENLAQNIFGTTEVIGKTLEIDGFGEQLINGVVGTPQLKSHLDFGVAIYQEPEPAYADTHWFRIGGYTYIRAAPGTTIEQLNERLDALAERYAFPVAYGGDDLSFDEWKERDNKIRFYARPIREIYFNADVKFDIGDGGDKQTVVTLSVIGIFILIIASINFMNLSTARSSGRTKEIGMRKVLGSKKAALVFQFLMESMIVTMLSAIIAAGLSEAFINGINQKFDNLISISLIDQPTLMLFTFVGVILLGVLSGLYPAFYLTSTKVIPLLKGMQLSRVLNLNLAKGLRNGLVVTQFTISTGLIIGSIFIYNQLIYLKNKDLGFAHEQVVVIENVDNIGQSKEAFKNQLLAIPGVQSASYSYRMPGDGSTNIMSSTTADNRAISVSSFKVDDDYKETLGLRIKEGEWFNEKHRGFDSLVVVNNAFIQQYDIVDPIGYVFGNYSRIIGVVEDFNYGNMRESIGPIVMRSDQTMGYMLALKVDVKEVPFDQIEATWNTLSNEPFAYHFLGENFVRLLAKERQTANAILIFTVLAIVISCLGLFGLAAFTADQRLHEFGIRKVLGATVYDIVKIFSFDFLKLVMIAFLASIPLAVWGVNLWLQGFADRISLGVGVFVLAGFLAIFIAFGTILFQSVKTGKLNPVDTIGND